MTNDRLMWIGLLICLSSLLVLIWMGIIILASVSFIVGVPMVVAGIGLTVFFVGIMRETLRSL